MAYVYDGTEESLLEILHALSDHYGRTVAIRAYGRSISIPFNGAAYVGDTIHIGEDGVHVEEAAS